jgi:protein involved in polysaccharide export with SLBB domain
MTRVRSLCVYAGLLLGLAGCSTSPTNPLGIFPEGQQLLKDTREARKVNAEPWPLPRELDKQIAPPYVVEPGDTLLVQPADLDSPIRIPGDQPVLADGSIYLGKYGRVVVAGLTLEHIETMVREHIAHQVKDAGPITVRIVSRQSKVYYVLGEVNAPGAYPLAGRETVLDGILAAGNINTRADLRKIILSRPTAPESCRVVLPVAYEEIVQLGDTSTNYQLQAGDRIFVPSKCLLDELKHHLGCEDKKECRRPQVPCTGPEACECDPCSSWKPAQHPAEVRPVLPVP